jgi:ArsR family transcriptional regulator, virulence genes transcriptional regulator
MSSYLRLFQSHADLLKALAHPRRLEIVHLLRDQELPVTDIHTMLDLPQANISQHLMNLREAEIVQTRRDGKQIFYRLADPKIVEACDLIREYLIDLNHDSELADHLSLSMKELAPIVTDPICKMRLSPKTAAYHFHHQGEDHYFCASGCLQKFKQSLAIIGS